MATDSSEYQTRIERLNELVDRGIDPYPSRTERTHEIREAVERFDEFCAEKFLITLAGRVKAIRSHGGSAFLQIEDGLGAIQVYVKKDALADTADYNFFTSFIGIGDFIEAKGVLFCTKTKEKTLLAEKIKLIAKSLRPLPEKWKGLTDRELRYRKRYLDLISNKDVRLLFQKRTAFINAMRNFLVQEAYMEVEVPVLEHIPGGADAMPFITQHNELDIDLYLRISLELHLKRLIVGGFDKVFEIGKVFRNEGMSTQHLQEFTMMECYEAYRDYIYYMTFVEKMYVAVIKETFGSLKQAYKEFEIDFTPPWTRIDYQTVFLEKTGIDLKECLEKESLVKKVRSMHGGGDFDFSLGRGRIIDQVYKRFVRPALRGPLFLINHPVDVSPLAKRKKDDPNIAERFQVIINGAEVGNGFSELNDPIDQRRRFEEQMSLRAAGDSEAQMLDEDYIEALEHGMPPTAGFGVGIDRFFSIAANQDSIRDVVLFPTMKPYK